MRKWQPLLESFLSRSSRLVEQEACFICLCAVHGPTPVRLPLAGNNGRPGDSESVKQDELANFAENLARAGVFEDLALPLDGSMLGDREDHSIGQWLTKRLP